MRSVEFGPHQRQLATSWNELTSDQLLAVAQVMPQTFEREAQLLDALLCALVGQADFDRLNVVQRVELRPLVAFLHAPADHAPLTAQLLPCLTLPHLPAIEQAQHFYGPREAFRNLRFDEFIFADTFYLRYLQTQEEEKLDQLVAVLYRPERQPYRPTAVDYAGDRREDFNEHLLAARAQQLARLAPHAKAAVLLWYSGCRRMLEQRYEYVFSGDPTTTATAGRWQDALHELAGGVHRLDATAHQALHNVLREMNRVLRQHEERQNA